jgi:hypothetical protein
VWLRVFICLSLLPSCYIIDRVLPVPSDAPEPGGKTDGAACEGVSDDSERFDARGAGKIDDPFILCSPGELVAMSRSVAAWAASYRLGRDIDLSGFGPSAGVSFEGIGSATTPFRGSFDGSGFSIRHVHIELPASDNVGFFRFADSSATRIERVHLVDVIISGRDNVGGLVGALERGTVIGASINGVLTGRNHAGGIVGAATRGASISTSGANVNVKISGAGAGGALGICGDGCVVMKSYARGTVEGSERVGGFTGATFGANTHQRVYATGAVNAEQGAAGGLIGLNSFGVLQYAFTTSDVASAGTSAGGVGSVIGALSLGSEHVFYLENATCRIGAGLACHAEGSAVAAKVIAELFDPASAPLSWGSGWTTVSDDFATPRVELAPPFDGCAAHMNDTPFAGGDGSVEAPFLICSVSHFRQMARSVYDGPSFFRLMADLDLQSATLTGFPVGDASQMPTVFLDGNGKQLRHLSLSDSSGGDVALFRRARGSIQRLALTDVAIASAGSAAALAAAFEGNISDVYVSGSVTANGTAAGIVAALDAGWLTRAYSTGNITSTNARAAGLGRYLVSESFSSATVDGRDDSGQVAMYNLLGTPNSQCSKVSLVSEDNFWDETATCTRCCTPAYGIGVPVTDFYDQKKPPLNAWDFDHVWTSDGRTFPSLR